MEWVRGELEALPVCVNCVSCVPCGVRGLPGCLCACGREVLYCGQVRARTGAQGQWKGQGQGQAGKGNRVGQQGGAC